MILQAASDNHRKPLLSLGYSPGLIVCVCKLIQGLSKDLESLRAWATLVKGCWHCTDFFQYPSACRSLLMSVGAGTDQCFTNSDCCGKCHSVVRLGSRVSHAVRCLSLTRQPCLGPVLFLHGSGVFSFGNLGRKELLLWNVVQGHSNSAVLFAKNCWASKQRVVSILNIKEMIPQNELPASLEP